MKTKKRIAIDMDGVIADVETHFLNWYFDFYGVRVPYEDLIGKKEEEAFPEKTALQKFVRSTGFFRTIPLMPGAVEAVKELMENFEVYIVSAATEFPQSLSEKHEWLGEHFPFISWRNIVFCGDKSMINADYMIDDHCKNLDHFKGTTILFNAAHNTNVTHHQRVYNWDEVLQLINLEETEAHPGVQ
jgi:5'-nucleotidase